LQAIGVILLLISIGTVVGPVGAVVIIYRDNLSQLVIPPQIQDILNGNSSIIQDNSNSNNNDNSTSDSGSIGFITPTFVSAQIDTTSRTFTITVNVTNNFNYDLTLNALNATVETSQDQTQLATINLSNPVTIYAGQTSLVTVSGTWMQTAENYLNDHAGATSIDVELINTTIDVNGITIQMNQPIEVGSIPLT